MNAYRNAATVIVWLPDARDCVSFAARLTRRSKLVIADWKSDSSELYPIDGSTPNLSRGLDEISHSRWLDESFFQNLTPAFAGTSPTLPECNPSRWDLNL